MPTHVNAVTTPPPFTARPKNKLLASLPEEDFERVRGHLRQVPIRRKQVFQRHNERIQHVVFLNGGVASITAIMQDGTMIETATIGREGFIGIDVFFDAEFATGETILQ